MNEFIPNCQYLNSVAEFSESLYALTQLSSYCRFFLGLTGSAISSNPETSSDIDLLMILPAAHFESDEFELPDNFNNDYWRMRSSSRKKPDVIGSFNLKNPAIRLEICNEQFILRLLRKKTISITRIKEIPKKNKVELFINHKGNTISRILDKDGLRSQTVSFIQSDGTIYWGMHFERVLLAERLFDNLCFFPEIIKARSEFLANADQNSDLNQLFYCSRHTNNLNILSHLISQKYVDR
ncbi:MAG: hypothetical protein V4577_07400 [Bacteroidota bacterium]